MRILGIDASLVCTGWGIIENGKVIDSGTIKTNAKQSFMQRLNTIREGMIEIIPKNPIFLDAIAIEDCYLGRNVDTLKKLARVQGLMMSVILSWYEPPAIYMYTPKTIKETIAGHGGATKEQVLKMVQLQAGYKGNQLDESDALAAALTCEREIT